MKSFFALIAFTLLSTFCSYAGEIKSKHFQVNYQTSKDKFFAQLLSRQLPTIQQQLKSLTGLEFKKPITIFIDNEKNFLKRFPLHENSYSSFDNATTTYLIFNHNRLINAIHPLEILIRKRLLYMLFRQNNIPENYWFEEAFYDVLLYEKNHLGGISLPNLNTKSHFRFLREDLKAWDSWIKKPTKIQVPSIKDSLQKIANTKFLILNDWYQFSKKKDTTLKEWVRKKIRFLKKKSPWQTFLSHQFAEKRFIKLDGSRAIYTYIMETFNYPNQQRIEDSSKYIFKYSLRMLQNKETKLCQALFDEVKLYPINSPYFCELGIHLTKGNNAENNIWLEDYLLNQSKRSPTDFNNPADIKKMLDQTINQPNPKFSLKNEELELYRTLQFLLFSGNKKLATQLCQKILLADNRHLDLLNLYWALSLIFNDQKGVTHFNSNAKIYNTSVWKCLQPYLKK